MTGNLFPLALVIDRFSNLQKEQIESLYTRDATFREICRDYAECVRMRDIYAHDSQNRDISRYRQEYEALIEALEEEMHAILTESRASSKEYGGKV